MMSVLLAIRDALIILALSWVGVSIEQRVREPAPAPAAESAPTACSGDGALCAMNKPSFNSFSDCPDA